ncbi:D-alanyl-D-alanine carboxypeptidase/D-alanyl-D-alanine endopeptidase [Corynebacterium ulceribovis]|uniref:D-alanyl-D-alanine carboxypeptidase/D-alanyl-D-alanine endopeptidase n=1 Tax=Corynebacterium ulceribovis TaxID=487732 RepID=UPI0012EA0BE2|nr:D-alanyl-D-alanine carboxypeptidase/D-alanyl-D-alanine-endopeptidase [Corynebacterium ulceribovis]
MTRPPSQNTNSRPVLWWVSLLAVLLAAAIIIGSALWLGRHGKRIVADPAAIATAASPTAAATDGIDDVDQLRSDVTEIMAKYATDPRLGNLAGMVTDAESGELLWQHNPDKPQRPASATKILTAAAALLTLPLDHRVKTTVHTGDAPGTIVLRGGGDVTLAQTSGDTGWHDGAASLADLAAQLPDPAAITNIVVDTSAWGGDAFNPEWDEEDIDAGFIAPMEPVMVDGARLNHDSNHPPKSHHPANAAGTAFAAEIAKLAGTNADSIEVDVNKQKTSGEEIAAVESAPLRDRLHDMMANSDNVLAEAIGREVAEAQNPEQAPTGESAAKATVDILQAHGVPMAGVDLKDNSGMAMANLIPSRTLSDIIVRSVGHDDADAKLRPLVETMSVAAGDGTLATRFAGQDGAGYVRGKTGTLTGTSALAGVTTTVGTDMLVFVLVSNDADVPAARAAQDELTSELTEVR